MWRSTFAVLVHALAHANRFCQSLPCPPRRWTISRRCTTQSWRCPGRCCAGRCGATTTTSPKPRRSSRAPPPPPPTRASRSRCRLCWVRPVFLSCLCSVCCSMPGAAVTLLLRLAWHRHAAVDCRCIVPRSPRHRSRRRAALGGVRRRGAQPGRGADRQDRRPAWPRGQQAGCVTADLTRARSRRDAATAVGRTQPLPTIPALSLRRRPQTSHPRRTPRRAYRR
jgi:hypothetical protein